MIGRNFLSEIVSATYRTEQQQIYIYSMLGVVLTSTNTQLNLDVIVNSESTQSVHIVSVIKKAYSLGYFLQRTFTKPSVSTPLKLCKNFIRPVLEFAKNVWWPELIRNRLESVQQRMTRFLYGNDPFRPSYSERLIIMSLPTLKHKRIRGDVVFTFKSLRLDNPFMQNLLTLCP